MAHDLRLEAAAFGFGVDFLDIFAERALYHRFLERIVARVTVTALLQGGYTARDNVREGADKA